MAVRVAEGDLLQLQQWLQPYLPHSFLVYHRVKNHLQGTLPDQAFYVDRWPDPQAVVTVVDPAGTKLECRDYLLHRVNGLYAVNDKALTQLLRDEKLVDWTQSVIFCGVAENLAPMVMSLTEEIKGSVVSEPAYLMKVTPQDLLDVPVPDDMKVVPACLEDVSIVDSTWKFSENGSDTLIRHIIQNFPSIILKTSCDQYIGHMIGQEQGTIGMLHIDSQFRRKGYAKVIISQLARKYFDAGEDGVYVLVETPNPPSINLHLSLGFKIVTELGYILG